MPVVTNQVVDPGGLAIVGARVQVDLIGQDGAGYVGGSSTTVFDVFETRTQGDGGWSITLVANSLITAPTGTVYKVTESRRDDAGDRIYHINVPNGAGPYWAGDILTAPPANVISSITLSDSSPAALGTAAAGSSSLGSRGNHVHPITFPHVAAATPTGGTSGDIKIGNGKIWINDGGTWRSVAIS